MELPEDEIIEKYAKRCGHCDRNTLCHMIMNLLVSHVDST